MEENEIVEQEKATRAVITFTNGKTLDLNEKSCPGLFENKNFESFTTSLHSEYLGKGIFSTQVLEPFEGGFIKVNYIINFSEVSSVAIVSNAKILVEKEGEKNEEA